MGKVLFFLLEDGEVVEEELVGVLNVRLEAEFLQNLSLGHNCIVFHHNIVLNGSIKSLESREGMEQIIQ